MTDPHDVDSASSGPNAIAPRKRGGPPTLYSDDLVAKIADLYASGMSLRKIAAMDGMPGYMTLFEWRERHDAFRTALARARVAKAETLVEDAGELLDAVDPDSGNGSARVSKAREQAAYRRWMASCLDRDTYGERSRVEVDARVQVVAAFVDLQAPPGGVRADLEGEGATLPHVVAPDGADGASV